MKATLEELLVRWQEGSLTEEELRDLNRRLEQPETRAVLAREFTLTNSLIEALQVQRARQEARAAAHAFETHDVRQADFDSHQRTGPGRTPSRWRWLPMQWRHWRPTAQPGWRALLAMGVSLLSLAAIAFWVLRNQPLARLELAPAGLIVQRHGRTLPAPASGLGLEVGDELEVPAHASASFVYPGEKTRIQLQSGARLTLQETEEGKRLEILRGSLTADVAPQPEGQPLVLLSPHAVATVVGTELAFVVNSNSSRVEVLSGTVRLARRDDEKSVVVSAGGCATAGAGIELAARPLLQAPWQSQDIGLTARPGSARFDSDGRKCHVRTHTSEHRRGRDDFHFVYQTLDGDGEIRAQVLQFERRDKRTKAGVVIRGSLRSDALTAFLRVNAGRGLEFKRRGNTETRTDVVGRETFPYWVRLVRQGHTITAYKSPDGQTWTLTGSGRFELGRRIYVGLGVTSADRTAAAAVFDHVSVITGGPTPL